MMLLWWESGTCREGKKKVLTQMYANGPVLAGFSESNSGFALVL
jgi:hypothetical protein